MDRPKQNESCLLLQERLVAIGWSWEMLLERCHQVILFGSRAANMHRPTSDHDLLCIGRGEARITPAVDMVWISVERLEGSEWLGSELAQHVAHYGCWLSGENTWGSAVFSSERAILQKADQIKARVHALIPRWDRLLPPYHRKYSRLVRRDLQRLQLLAEGKAVPPSPALDSEWSEQTVLAAWARAHVDPSLIPAALLDKLQWQEALVESGKVSSP